MKHLTIGKARLLLILTLCWAAASVSPVWAHSGHDHGVQPRIALPAVLAKVNGADIKKSSIWAALTRTVKRYKQRGIPLTRGQEKVAAKKYLQDQINRNLLLEKANQMGIQVSDSLVQAELDSVKKNFNSEKEFQAELKKRELTLDQYRHELKDDLLIDAVLRRELGGGIQITDDQVEAYFRKNSNRFSSTEQRRASVILIKGDPKDRTQGERKAQEALKKILSKLKKGGDFAELAQLHSQDSLAKRGGDLGFFTKDRMFGPFAKLAFQLKVGQVSEIFRTKHGFQILKVTDKKAAVNGSLETEKENIRKLLLDGEIDKKKRPYLEALRKKAKIKIYF